MPPKPAAKKTSKAKSISTKKPKPPAKAAAQPKKTRSARIKGLPEKLLETVLKILAARKAQDIISLDLRPYSAIADYMVIASGGSGRQLAAIAHYISEAFAKQGIKALRIEGLTQGDWVLIDAGDILIHLFRPEVRDYYRLETIWQEKGSKTAP
ncbi:MAG: ribosome silencing factor [Alphaproteobacteria bacterium]|nr:ribosome silencing factor [Alphaproteobacteria bacterium]